MSGWWTWRRRAFLGLLAAALAAVVAIGVTPSSDPCWRAWLVSVERVIDGDTFEAEVQIWPRLTVTERVRVLGVDTPERAEIPKWKAARDFTEAWLRSAGPTTVTVCKYDNFGRALGTVVSFTHGDLTAALIMAGHGVVYPPPRRER